MGTRIRWKNVAYTPATYWDFPRNRAKARKAKSAYWFSGQMCANGHVAPRYTNTNRCVLCQQAENRMYAARRGTDAAVKQELRAAGVLPFDTSASEVEENRRRRSEAKANYQLRFEAVSPCKKCGSSERYVSTNYCAVCSIRSASKRWSA